MFSWVALSAALHVRVARYVVAAHSVVHDFFREIRAPVHSPGAGARRVPFQLVRARSFDVSSTSAGRKSTGNGLYAAAPAPGSDSVFSFAAERHELHFDELGVDDGLNDGRR